MILRFPKNRRIVSETYVRSGQGNASPDLFAPHPNLTGRAYAKMWSYMSIKLRTAVWQLDIPPIEKLILLALSDHVNVKGADISWPSIPHLAKKCSMSDRSIQRYIKILEKKGLLRLEYRLGHSIKFHILVTHLSPVAENLEPSPSPSPDISVTSDGDTAVTQNRNLNHKESLARIFSENRKQEGGKEFLRRLGLL